MALEESDFARIREITELSGLKVIQAHLKESHEPVWDRLGKIESKADEQVQEIRAEIVAKHDEAVASLAKVSKELTLFKGVGLGLQAVWAVVLGWAEWRR